MSDFARYRYVDTIPRREKVRRQLWVLVYHLAFRPTPRGVLNGWRLFLLRSFGAKIGEGARVAPSCFVWAPWNLELGDFSVLGDHVDCYSMAKIRIGSKVAVSQRSFLCAGTHDVTSPLRPLITRPISIGDHVWIAAETMVLPGVRIGAGAVIGARSLVTRDMPPWMICAGHVCQPLRSRILSDPAERALTSPEHDR